MLLALALLCVSLAPAQQTVTPGNQLHVETTNGKTEKGTLETISANELTIRRGNKPRTLSRQDVRAIRRLQPRSAKRNIALGAAIGLGAFVAGHAIALPDERAPTHPSDPAYMAISAAAGAAIGWAVSRPKRTLVYDASAGPDAWPVSPVP